MHYYICRFVTKKKCGLNQIKVKVDKTKANGAEIIFDVELQLQKQEKKTLAYRSVYFEEQIHPVAHRKQTSSRGWPHSCLRGFKIRFLESQYKKMD